MGLIKFQTDYYFIFYFFFVKFLQQIVTMGFDTLHPLQYSRITDAETLLRDRFVYEEQNEIKTWHHKRRKRITDIENDLSYQFRGQFVVTRPRIQRSVKPVVVAKRYAKGMYRTANYKLACCPVDFDGVYRSEDGLYEKQMYPTLVEIHSTRRSFRVPIQVDHVQFIKNLEDPELVPRERKPDEADETNDNEQTPVSQAEKTRRQKKLNKKKKSVVEAELNNTKPIVFKGLYTGNKYDINGEVISAAHKVSEMSFKSAFNEDSRNSKERYVNDVQPVVDAIERGVADFQFYHPLPGEPRHEKVGMGVTEPVIEAHSQQSTLMRNAYLREWDRELAGLERICAPTDLPTILRDPPRVTKLIDTLSFKTRRFLSKNNDRHDNVRVMYQEKKDGRLRSRVSHALSAIVLKTIMDPVSDMNVLANAFPLLLRAPGTSIRDVWTIGLELLTWRRTQGEYDGLQRTKDEDFLEWLFINYQSAKVLKASHSINRDRMSGPEFFPHLIIQKLRFGDPKSAIERIDEALLESRFSDNPVIHFFRGVACCQLIKRRRQEDPKAVVSNEIRTLIETARHSFDTAREKGGVFPEHILGFELRDIIGEYEDKDASENTDDDSARDIDDDGNGIIKKENNKTTEEPHNTAILHHVYTPFNISSTRY